MRIEGIVFIHPNDFQRILKYDGNALDIIIEDWYDGLQTQTINNIRYRQTTKVPEELPDSDAEGNLIYPDEKVVAEAGHTEADNADSLS